MKKTILFTLFVTISTVLSAQNVNIPDAIFKSVLLAHGGSVRGTDISVIDTDRNGEISTAEAAAYTGLIHVPRRNITDLTGIEAFTSITKLDCGNNRLTSLDVSKNTNLTSLKCGSNQLTSLDVSKNTKLQELNCDNNQLTSLDISANVNLRIFVCHHNSQLTSLNVANGRNSNNRFYGLSYVLANNNANLSCIQIDAGFTPTIGTWYKDASTIWSANCATASVNDPIFNQSLKMHPNPANTILNITSSETSLQTIEIYDTLGKKVLKTSQETIDISNLTKGLYIIKIQGADNRIATKKFIKN